jgi:hypothetical protein
MNQAEPRTQNGSIELLAQLTGATLISWIKALAEFAMGRIAAASGMVVRLTEMGTSVRRCRRVVRAAVHRRKVCPPLATFE